MSSMRLIYFGLLLLSVANGDNNGVHRRSRRSAVILATMLETLTDFQPTDFGDYGHYCGLGGSGDPVDPIDGCCQSHDYCYKEASKSFCPKYEENAIYTRSYEWNKTEEGEATCGKNRNRCSAAGCLCDVVLVNCLEKNKHFYNSSNSKIVTLS